MQQSRLGELPKTQREEVTKFLKGSNPTIKAHKENKGPTTPFLAQPAHVARDTINKNPIANTHVW